MTRKKRSKYHPYRSGLDRLDITPEEVLATAELDWQLAVKDKDKKPDGDS